MTSFMKNTGGASFVDLLKDGAKHFQGVDEAVARNIEACQKLSEMTATSFGPNGMNKMVINHIDKIFVTSDSATILKEMEVQHPAAKLVYLASEMQKNECGDYTNWCVMMAGELLTGAGKMLQLGIPAPDIVEGFVKGHTIAKEALAGAVVKKNIDLRDIAQVQAALTGVVAAKLHGLESIVAPLITQACISVVPKNAARFSIDNVRVAKVPGGALSDSMIVKGFVMTRDVESSLKSVHKAKIAVFSTGIEPASTETKGTVLLKSAEELRNYSKTEEDAMSKVVDEIKAAGVNVVISGGSVHELALHFFEHAGILVMKSFSKFDTKRLCIFSGATAMSRVGAPNAEEIGKCDHVEVKEIGGTTCTVFNNDDGGAKVATVLVRSSTRNQLEDINRAIDSGVSAYRMLCKDPRQCAGAGAMEVELSRAVGKVADSTTGLDQYGLRKYAEAFECVPAALARNSAQDSVEVLAALHAEHEKGNINHGIDVLNRGVCDAVKKNIFAHTYTVEEALRLATDAVVTVLRVDQIIMAKQAGGPKPPGGPGMGM